MRLLLALLLTACATSTSLDASVPDSGVPTDAPPDAGPPTIAWGPCQTGFRDECAIVRMPLDHDHPEGELIDVHLSRRGRGPTQIWLLQGGPGASAESFYNLHDDLTAIDPALEVYTIEFRGVGDSTRLGCAAEGATTSSGAEVSDEEWPLASPRSRRRGASACGSSPPPRRRTISRSPSRGRGGPSSGSSCTAARTAPTGRTASASTTPTSPTA